MTVLPGKYKYGGNERNGDCVRKALKNRDIKPYLAVEGNFRRTNSLLLLASA